MAELAPVDVHVTAVNPTLMQHGDRVLIPLDSDTAWDELDEIREHLKKEFPGVQFVFLSGTPMTHAIVYRPQPVARVLCGATWHQHSTEHENHRCQRERHEHPAEHVCRCGRTAPVVNCEALGGHNYSGGHCIRCNAVPAPGAIDAGPCSNPACNVPWHGNIPITPDPKLSQQVQQP